MTKSNFQSNIKSFSQIANEWQKIQQMDAKSRMKTLRTLGHDIYEGQMKSELSLEELALYIKILRAVVKTQSFPQKAARALSQLLAKWALLSGAAKIQIQASLAATLSLISGQILCAAPDYFNLAMLENDFSDQRYLSFINQGKCYLINTGGDGSYSFQLRLVDGPGPLLLEKEYKNLVDASETAIIALPSGKFALADPADLANPAQRVMMQLEPGNYKINIYTILLSKKNQSFCFYVVLSKTEQAAVNDFDRIYLCDFMV